MMTSTNGTPGVYIEEKNAFPGSVVAVETAVPVFIGYTEKAEQAGKSLEGEPTSITSFAEYTQLFGQGFNHKFTLAVNEAISPFKSEFLINPPQIFYLYNCIRLFFQNGGGNCYIMSIGTYGNDNKIEIKEADFTKADLWATLEKTLEPTLVVLPDLVSNRSDCYNIYKMVLKHCEVTQSRFAIFDVIPDPEDADIAETINFFRENIGSEALNYGAAYYPWLHTSIVSSSEINFNNLAMEKEALVKLLAANEADEILTSDEQDPEKRKKILEYPDEQFHQYLLASSSVYSQIIDEVTYRLNLLPPAAAMAGIYTLVDTSAGVWKAPANVSLSMVNSPSVNISDEEQQSLNIDIIGGKSINAIRLFPGIGTLVWGARTLDGNGQDWRYINVRRTMIMIEQSLKLACRAYIFEPNNSGTWATMKSMMNNFLVNLWKQGALAGATPEDAFDVQIGLGATMTPTDILDGYLRITANIAIVRPAEFIVITFEQQQQKS